MAFCESLVPAPSQDVATSELSLPPPQSEDELGLVQESTCHAIVDASFASHNANAGDLSCSGDASGPLSLVAAPSSAIAATNAQEVPSMPTKDHVRSQPSSVLVSASGILAPSVAEEIKGSFASIAELPSGIFGKKTNDVLDLESKQNAMLLLGFHGACPDDKPNSGSASRSLALVSGPLSHTANFGSFSSEPPSKTDEEMNASFEKELSESSFLPTLESLSMNEDDPVLTGLDIQHDPSHPPSEKWSTDVHNRVKLVRFQFESFDESDYARLCSMLDNVDHGVVTEGLLCFKIDEIGLAFAEKYLPNTLKVCCFRSRLKGDFPETLELTGLELNREQLANYFCKRKEFLSNFENQSFEHLKNNDDAILTFPEVARLHVGQVAFHCFNLKIFDNLDLKQIFTQGSKLLSGMLPGGKDCLMQKVSVLKHESSFISS